jgi:hypothetical protein
VEKRSGGDLVKPRNEARMVVLRESYYVEVERIGITAFGFPLSAFRMTPRYRCRWWVSDSSDLSGVGWKQGANGQYYVVRQHRGTVDTRFFEVRY